MSKSTDNSVETWQFPEIDGAHSVNENLKNIKIPTANELENIQQLARKEALDKGYKDGLEKGLSEGKGQMLQQAKNLQSLITSLAEPLKDFDEQVESELVELAIQIAKQIIRRELKTDPGQIVAVVREAIAALPSSSHQIKLHLHPEDANLVKTALQLEESASDRWHIIEDPVLARGGCRVLTENSQIDATIENKLTTLIASLLGDEREVT